jgi:hypothetical protein
MAGIFNDLLSDNGAPLLDYWIFQHTRVFQISRNFENHNLAHPSAIGDLHVLLVHKKTISIV